MKNNKKSFDLIMGRNCLEELISYDPDKIIEVFTTQTEKENRKKRIITELNKNKITTNFVSHKALSDMAGSDSHQSFVAKIKKREFIPISSFIEKYENKCRILMLDSLEDPQNMGSIFRSAECFGIDGVIWSKNRGTSITPVVSKTSCGASEMLNKIVVSNLATTVLLLKERGFSIIIAQAGEASSSLCDFTFPEKSVLIVGSEKSGVQPLICKYADYSISIPMKGKITSLNVSQATSIFLYHWTSNN
jgi:23S rRNA (guanosine2251-2'-O)-methyltransferase